MMDRDADFSPKQESQMSRFLSNIRDAEPTLLFGAAICSLIGFIDFFFNGLAIASIIALCIISAATLIGFFGLLLQKYVWNPTLSVLVSSTVTATAFGAATCGFLYATGSLSSVSMSMKLGMKSALVCDIAPSYCNDHRIQITPTPADKQRSDVIVLRYDSVSGSKAASIMRSLSLSGWQLHNGVASISMGASPQASSTVWYFHEQDKKIAYALAQEAARAMGLKHAFPVMDFSTAVVQIAQDSTIVLPGHIRILLADA
jgi:hypothetical protein